MLLATNLVSGSWNHLPIPIRIIPPGTAVTTSMSRCGPFAPLPVKVTLWKPGAAPPTSYALSQTARSYVAEFAHALAATSSGLV